MKKRSTADNSSRTGIGPQCRGDGPFRRRMRLHQSWYRHEVLDVPFGTGPTQTSTTCYGNMLSADAADAGLNFLTPDIHKLAAKRIEKRRGAVEPFRLLRNMLSSQPMCFNLLSLVELDHDFGTVLARDLWGTHIGRVTAVKFEWAPTPKEEYLNDRTAFDAFIEYESNDGLGFIGVETKLSEPFSPKEYDGQAYRRWMCKDGPWRSDALPQCKERSVNQLWRNHLLAWALLRHEDSKYVRGCLTVIHHNEDVSCAKSVETYRKLLRDDSTFQSFSLEKIVSVWRPHAAEWAEQFEERYVALVKSKDAKPY